MSHAAGVLLAFTNMAHLDMDSLREPRNEKIRVIVAEFLDPRISEIRHPIIFMKDVSLRPDELSENIINQA